ncbi:integrase core domain-containing protein [Streptomyces mirabilis]|uniref:integrase core domain-containing protein n=1 Tax=Streptomyces mirabilis TaxID=68239 RepID=UPI0036997DBA
MGLRASVGRTGVCWDNAMAESFFGDLKNELVHRTTFPTRAHAHRAIDPGCRVRSARHIGEDDRPVPQSLLVGKPEVQPRGVHVLEEPLP